MGVVHGSGQRLDQRQRLTRRQRFAVQRLGQGRTFDVFDSVVEQLAIAFAGFEDLHDIGMRQPAEHVGLAA